MCAERSVVLSAHVTHRLTPAEVRAIEDMVTALEYGTSRPARSPSSHSGSARSGPRPQPGTAWSGRTAGADPGSACIRPNRRWAFERREPTRCGTSTRQ